MMGEPLWPSGKAPASGGFGGGSIFLLFAAASTAPRCASRLTRWPRWPNWSTRLTRRRGGSSGLPRPSPCASSWTRAEKQLATPGSAFLRLATPGSAF
eukprot:scaffold7656_cov121-Isochrysis_galbana.AAC.2